MSFSHEEIKDLPDKPFQPQHYSFPPRSFGTAQPENRFFQASWFHCFSWIHIMMQLMFLLSALFVAKL